LHTSYNISIWNRTL